MPRPKTDALIELSAWMEQAHQLQSAIAAIDERVPAFQAKGPKTAKGSKKPSGASARKRRAKRGPQSSDTKAK
jgi:hypothetical protein